MSNPTYYQQSEAVQRTTSQLIREEYLPEIPEMIWKVGSPTNRLFRPSSKIAHAANQGLIERVITGRANSGRATRTLLADFKKGRRSTADRINIRLNYDDPSANDFTSIESSTALPWYDFTSSGADASMQVLERAQADVFDSIDYTTSVLMHSDSTGAIGLINGTPKLGYDDELTYAGAATYASGSEASFPVDGHTIGVFKENVYLDFYSAAGVLLADEVRIVAINYEEKSLSVALSEDSTVANLDDLVDNAVIYLAGTYGAGFKCAFAEMFKTTYASDSWVGGVDRGAADKKHWVPIRTRMSASSAPMQKSYLDDACRAIGYRTSEAEGESPVFIAGSEIIDNLRSDIGDAAISTESVNDRGTYTIGELAVGYQHPVVGRINMVGDYTAKNSVGYMVFPEDMTVFHAEVVGPVVMSEGTSGKGFERVEGSESNSGGSKFYKLEVMDQKCPFFTRINRSAGVFNIE